MSSTDLFKEFNGVSKTDWLSKVVTDLQGDPIEKLNWVFNGEPVSPFYHCEDLPESKVPINIRTRNNSWHIGECFDATDPLTTNKTILRSLELGAAAICIEVGNVGESEISQIFSGIQHEWISTHLDLSKTDNALRTIQLFCKDLEQKNQKATIIKGSLRLNTNDDSYWIILKEVFQCLPQFRILLNADSSEEQSASRIALDILMNTYDFFQNGQEQNIALDILFDRIQYKIYVGDEFYRNIVLLRSVSLLVAQLCSAYNVSFESSVSIETWLKESDQTEEDNYNLIKNTSQIVSAVIGGADYVYATCESLYSKIEDENNRIQRNISHVLQLESYMDRVADPAAGSYFFESMTDQFCRKIWLQFQNREEL